MPAELNLTDPQSDQESGAASSPAHATHPPDPRPDQLRDLRAQAARTDLAERRRITQRLRLALAERNFVLQYQPKIDLRSGRTTGAEALLRLRHKRRGLIPAGLFMPVAERSDIANDIGAWMLGEACREAATWPAAYSLSLNISNRQLQSGRLTKQLIEALAQTGLQAARLELELSEAVLIDENEDTSFSLSAARAMGVGLALDDFGAGYASLSVLKRLPLNTLKLDRSVVSTLQREDDDTAIPRAAIEVAHALGCKVVADGVETEMQTQRLVELGCDQAQGNFFSAPLTAAELPHFLK